MVQPLVLPFVYLRFVGPELVLVPVFVRDSAALSGLYYVWRVARFVNLKLLRRLPVVVSLMVTKAKLELAELVVLPLIGLLRLLSSELVPSVATEFEGPLLQRSVLLGICAGCWVRLIR